MNGWEIGPPEAQWEKGDLKLLFHGHKLAGEFALVSTNRNKGKDWLLIKKKDFAVRPGWDPESDTRSVLQTPADLSSIEGATKEPHAGEDRANAGHASKRRASGL